MIKVVVCYKWVLDEATIKVDSQTRALKLRDVGHKISLYDLNAIEEGVQVQERLGASCMALSAGTEEIMASRKDVLSRGPAEAYFVTDSLMSEADSFVTSQVLAAAIRKIGDVDLVLCSEGSADTYAQQVGLRMAQVLGWPVIPYVTKVNIEDKNVIAHRAVEEGIEVIESPLPVVLTLTSSCNTPRIPGLKQIMSAGKKPYTVFSSKDLDLDSDHYNPRIRRLKTVGNVSERKKIKIEGSPETAFGAEEAITLLIKEGVL